MIWMISILAVIIIGFVGVLVARALQFKPPTEEEKPQEEIIINQELLVSRFSQMVACKTVSNRDKTLVNPEEFIKFKGLLRTLYPKVYAHCQVEEIGETGILFHWQGQQAASEAQEKISSVIKQPSKVTATVFMSHYDVVPVHEELWTQPAFEGLVKDGVIWGRGTLDTKSTLCSVLEAAEYLIETGFVPDEDLYFAFSGDEEISGPSAPAIVEVLKERDVKISLVIDEGGTIAENIFPGVTKPCALIGTGEKGYMDIDLLMTGKGGHASAPPAHTLIGYLAQAATKIENNPFPCRLTPPAAQMLDTLGRHSSFGMKLIFANLWCMKPILDRQMRKAGGELNAILRTTVALTRMEGGKAFNVLPPQAKMSANIRILSGDTRGTVVDYLKKVIDNPDVKIHVHEARNATPYAKTNTPAWHKVKKAVGKTWGPILVSPYLMMAGTDSRHYADICENVLKFSPMRLSKEERSLMHSNDERIKVQTLTEMVVFYVHLMGSC